MLIHSVRFADRLSLKSRGSRSYFLSKEKRFNRSFLRFSASTTFHSFNSLISAEVDFTFLYFIHSYSGKIVRRKERKVLSE